MVVIRVYPIPAVMDAIEAAAYAFEERLAVKLAKYNATLKSAARLISTERRETREMFV